MGVRRTTAGVLAWVAVVLGGCGGTLTEVVTSFGPTTPTGLTATVVSPTQIDLAWMPSTDDVGVTGYVVRRGGVQVASPTGTSYSDTGLTANTTYSYTVAARDTDGNESAASSTAIASTSAQPVFPLAIHGSGRYLVDASGNPWQIHGEAAWSLIADLSQADTELYLEDRRQRGFNAVLTSLIEHFFTQNAPRNNDGDVPFTVDGDFSTPNEAYFAHADWVIQRAAEKEILVMLVPAYLGFGGGNQGWYQDMVDNGAAKMRDYGRYVGQRYAGFTNVFYVQGGDYDPPMQALTREIALGIREFDTQALHTVHGHPGTVVLDYWNAASEPWLQVNNVYTYGTVYSATLSEYARAGPFPLFFMEGRYENENMPQGTEQRMRVQAYQSRLSGAMGHLFGNNPIWHFDGPGIFAVSPADWRLWLDSPGARSMTHHVDLLSAHEWWLLEPDAANTVLTGGLGSGLDRAVAARTGTGSVVLAYLPSLRSITIDMGQLAGPSVAARWFDPASGSFTTVGGSPFPASGLQGFTPPGINSSGFGDWVLELVSVP